MQLTLRRTLAPRCCDALADSTALHASQALSLRTTAGTQAGAERPAVLEASGAMHLHRRLTLAAALSGQAAPHATSAARRSVAQRTGRHFLALRSSLLARSLAAFARLRR
jgi:hypothetical protein